MADPTLLLDRPLSDLDGVSRALARKLADPPFGLQSVRDLLEHYPRQEAYRDAGEQQAVRDVVEGSPATVVGTIDRWSSFQPRRGRRRLTISRAVVIDDHGGRIVVPFFNQEWRPKAHPPGTRVAVSGTVERYRSDLQLKNPKLVVLDPEADLSGAAQDAPVRRIQPTYRASEQVPTHRIARLVGQVLDQLPPLPDHLPDEVRSLRGLARYDWALRAIHRPDDAHDVELARARLVYDELFLLQLAVQRRRRELEDTATGLAHHTVEGGAVDAFLSQLPFTPTGDQVRAFAEIDADLAGDKPMHRLLQGDVGTGKTLVAAHAMLRAVDQGRQAVLMAPTGVLAEQHLRTFSDLLAGALIPRLQRPPRIALLVGSTRTSARARILRELVTGEADVLIGTHAVLEDEVTFADLGVVVVDEQHRFGVNHRLRLRDKRGDGRTPDVLVMTATPIPRSLALTVYGDLEVTVLKERPASEDFTVRTEVIPSDSPRRGKLYDFVRREVEQGRRAYIVCPLIEDSEALEGVAAAVPTHAELSRGPLADLDVGLVHGRMTAAERDEAMEAFRAGTRPVLVATTVIEVGVNVGEASVMVVEDADRFGISQLHQLRGRLYRGHPTNYCVLFSRDPEDNPRLEALAGSEDGFELAEVDLRLRREGKLFDVAQTGESDLRIASLVRDVAVIAEALHDARTVLDADPTLGAFPRLRAEVDRRYAPADLAKLESG